MLVWFVSMCPPSVSTFGWTNVANCSHALQRSRSHVYRSSSSVWRTDGKRRRTTNKTKQKRNSCNCPVVPPGRGTAADPAGPFGCSQAKRVCRSLVGLSKTGSCWSSSGVHPLPRGHRTDRRGGRNTWARHILHLPWPAPAARSGRLAVGSQIELFCLSCLLKHRCSGQHGAFRAQPHVFRSAFLKVFHTSSPFPAHPAPRVFFLSSDWSCWRWDAPWAPDPSTSSWSCSYKKSTRYFPERTEFHL